MVRKSAKHDAFFAGAKKGCVMGERVYLRPLTLSDATKEYLSWLNDKETNTYLETRHSTMKELREYLQARVNNPNVYFAGVFDRATNRHIGNVKLEPIDWEKRRAVFGILIGNPSYRGKGIGTEATKLLVRHAFENLGLEEIELGVIAENLAGCRAYEKAGFKIVGVKKGAVNHDGALFDDVVMRITKDPSHH